MGIFVDNKPEGKIFQEICFKEGVRKFYSNNNNKNNNKGRKFHELISRIFLF